MEKENYYLKNYCCYFNTVENFLTENKSDWMSMMKSSFKENFPDLPLDNSQVQAWDNCFTVLQNDLKPISQKFPGFDIIFEYILPYEAGRRPDVILLSDLDLDISLRTHTASDASKFVNLLLDGQLDKAKQLTPSLIDNRFFMYYTRDLQKAKEYCIERYKNNGNKRYGCLVSSKARESGPLGPYHFYQEYYHKPKIAKWFNAPVSDPESCCSLESVVTEFDCQGLEIDMPIIGWNDDLFWDKTQNTWKVKSNRKIIDSGDEFTQRINSYRVLLTRGRDGFIVFIPNSNKPDTQEKMNTIAEIFNYLGVPLLK